MIRRRIGRIVVASLLGALVAPVVGFTSRTLAIPRTLYARVVLRGSLPDSSAPLPFRATHLGFEWSDGARPPEFRSSADGVTWMPWRPLEASADLSDPQARRYFSDLISGRDARFVEVREPGAGNGVAGPVVVTALNTRDGPRAKVRAPVPRTASAAAPGPRVFRRAEWGADESMRKVAPTFARVRRIFVHHTATDNDDPDPAGTLRAIYAYHTRSRGFDDIAYNFLIDSRGNVYEGRYARSYETQEEPSSENENGMGLVGAHVAHRNIGSLGVALLGDFRSVPPRPEAVNALVDVLAWKADRNGVAPGGVDEEGLPDIAGHRDARATECPGDRLYAQLPGLKERVEARIREVSALSAPAMPTGTQLHPDSGSEDRTPEVTGATSRSAVRVDVAFDGAGAGFHHLVSVAPRDNSFTVGDADFGPAALHPDRYAVRATAYDREGRSSAATPVASDYMISARIPTGYWVLGPDGTVLTYGSAHPYGSARDRGLNSPAIGLEATPSGKGYWLV
ncbi:MAG: N-acetylmuramoyl-L-alanine amidase, partial [Actinomycetota bacterium]